MSTAVRLFNSDDAAQLGPWFADETTTRWMGSPDYPALLLDLAGEGGRWAFVAVDGDELVALVDVEQDAEEPSSGTVAVVVAPSRRGRGIGRSLFAMVLARPELATLREFVGEVETDNVAAAKCVLAAGFVREGAASDPEFERYVLQRSRAT